MTDLTIAKIVLYLLGLLLILQIITTILITISYKWRRRKMAQTGYAVIELAPCSVTVDNLQIYMDGISLFADMELAIRGAQRRVMFESFIWKDDVLGRKFRDLFIEKAQEGVEVYLSFDRIGNSFLGGSRIKFPKDIPTLHFAPYFAMWRLPHLLSPSHYNVSHRKLLVVDDEIGFVGGYNLGEEYRTEWRDTHLRIIGPDARDLSHAFIDFWNHYLRRQDNLPYPKLDWSNVVNVVRNDPLRRNYPIRGSYLQAIERAQSHIYITNAYFIPDPAIRIALMDAARRGVDVQIILPWESNHLLVDWVARHWFADYLNAGAKLFGYEGAMIHAKSVTIDGVWTMIGTANLDRLSLWLNHEINAVIYDHGVAAQMEEIFACDKRQTRLIEREAWENRSIRARLGERILAPLWPLV